MKINNKDFNVLITAKSRSTELKNKNLKKIKNKTLVEFQIETFRKIKNLEIFLSSDSDRILSLGENKKNVYPIKRPKRLCQNDTSSEEVLMHLIQNLKKIPKFFIISQPTSPFLDHVTIINCMKKIFYNNKASSLTSVIKTPHKYHYTNQRLVKENGKSFFLFKKKILRRQKKIETFVHGNLFIVKTKSFLKQKKILSNPVFSYKLKNTFHSIDIDTKDDYKLAKLIYLSKLI